MKILKIIFYNFLFLFILLLLLEGFCRIAKIPFDPIDEPAENAIAQFDHELGWSYIPNKSKQQEFGENNIVAQHFDENGIRIPESNYKLSKVKPSVLFVGGSFTMGHGLSYEQCFAGQFGAFSEVPYQIINAGVQAYGTDQSFLLLKRIFPRFNVKFVVYTFIDSHIQRNGNYDRRMLFRKARRYLGTKPVFKINRRGDLVLAKKPVRYVNYYHSWWIDFLEIKIGERFGTFPPWPIELTKKIVLEMKNFCESNDAHFILINWNEEKIFDDSIFSIINVLAHPAAGWENMIITGDLHPDERANAYVAQLLLRYFLKNDLLKTQEIIK
jgi:hypothetical protein